MKNPNLSTKKPKLTVCVCTYNRAALLGRTLDAMAAMEIPAGVDWELLVIDNNSTDRTKDVALGFRGRLPLRYVFEREQGLSNARNRALEECRSDLLIYIDDDATVAKGCLAAYSRASHYFPEANYFGGRILLNWEDDRPRWVRDENMPLLAGLFGRYDLGTSVREYLPMDPLPFGGNFAITRKVFESLPQFRPDLGVTGKNIGRGEETEYLMRARESGFFGVYVGKAVCYHRIGREKLSLGYMLRYGIEKGIAERRINGFRGDHGSALLDMAKNALKGLFQLAKGRGDRFRQCVINMGIQRGLRVRK